MYHAALKARGQPVSELLLMPIRVRGWSDSWDTLAKARRPHYETGCLVERIIERIFVCQVSVGGCGMWGVAKDNSLWFRVGTAGRTGEWAGDNWTKVEHGHLDMRDLL